jgi:hypothetical protein
VSNFFSELGYFTRTHIQLYPKDGKISDIDVLCIKFDNQLIEYKNIIEVKRRNDSYSVIFQLYGLKTYFGNCNAFFVNDKISHRTLKITKDLGIKVYYFETLKVISKNDQKFKSLNLSTEHVKIHERYLTEIKGINPDLFWGYNEIWLERDPYFKLYKIQSLFKITDELIETSSGNQSLLWIRKELFMLCLVTICEISSDCIELDPKSINSYIEDKYYNLGTPKEKKIQLKEGVDKLIKIIEEKEGISLGMDFELLPNWISVLTRCVKTIISAPAFAQKNLLLNERIFKSFLLDEPVSIREIAGDGRRADIVAKINTDVLMILHRQHIKPDFSYFI